MRHRESKREQARASESKQEQARASESKREQARASEGKREQARASESKREQARASESKREQAARKVHYRFYLWSPRIQSSSILRTWNWHSTGSTVRGHRAHWPSRAPPAVVAEASPCFLSYLCITGVVSAHLVLYTERLCEAQSVCTLPTHTALSTPSRSSNRNGVYYLTISKETVPIDLPILARRQATHRLVDKQRTCLQCSLCAASTSAGTAIRSGRGRVVCVVCAQKFRG